MINMKFEHNIVTIYDEDRNDDIVFDLNDVVVIRRIGKSKLLLPPMSGQTVNMKVDTATKIKFTMKNQEEILIDAGIFDRKELDEWEPKIEEIYKKILVQWKKYKAIK